MHPKLKTIKSYLNNLGKKNKTSEEDSNDFVQALMEMKLSTKATSFRMAKQFHVLRPVLISEITKVPAHIRGYAIAGAIDLTIGYNYLKNAKLKNILDKPGIVQAVEGWMGIDPPALAADYYCEEPFTPDKWTIGLIENAQWGDPLRAAARIAKKSSKHLEWARNLLNTRDFGDPSNAMVDLFEARLIHNPNYIVDFVVKDWVGCQSSAAKRLFDKNFIRAELFKVIVKNAKRGDPAGAVLDSFLIEDKDFAKEIVQKDIGASSPQLAITLTRFGIDTQWAYEMVKKSKHSTSEQLKVFNNFQK